MINNFVNKGMETKKNILIVDDYEGCRMVITAMLKDYDYDVDSARNGQEALEFMKNKRYHLVITDMEMPGMNGIDLLKNIKTMAPDTKVIIASGNGTVNSYMDSMVWGASEYLNKPLELKGLTKAVANVFSQVKHPRLVA
jgi:DNA-binding NtrC family response regulator